MTVWSLGDLSPRTPTLDSGSEVGLLQGRSQQTTYRPNAARDLFVKEVFLEPSNTHTCLPSVYKGVKTAECNSFNRLQTPEPKIFII